MYEHAGGSSFSQIFHHSRLIIAPSSAVGFCMYCAFHFATGIDAFTPSSSSKLQYSGQSDSPEGIIAGNSTISHLSAPFSLCFARTFAVKSRIDHRVITIIIAPPGCKRCLGPEVYHSYTLSSAVVLSASCSETGSSIIAKSAPRPAKAPPTPTA